MKTDPVELNERIFVITGASGGLGRTVTHYFAEIGAKIALVGTNAEKLSVLGRELNLDKNRTLQIAVDLSQPESAQSILDAVIERFGRADILLHLVGGWIGGMPVKMVAEKDIATMLQQHLWTTFYLARVFSPHMVANGWGRLVVVSSPSANLPPANRAPYSIGKSA
jgi:NAD(P)-dependent dehydrogenase (short-subunit alcohol dehydrogenase family)